MRAVKIGLVIAGAFVLGFMVAYFLSLGNSFLWIETDKMEVHTFIKLGLGIGGFFTILFGCQYLVRELSIDNFTEYEKDDDNDDKSKDE